ncbi:MAG TPA: hypothetical protein VME19_19845 [Streptosporangiaceae bacterium]|nr:hypothetical protein [Streptosporangiaceae bacterium]
MNRERAETFLRLLAEKVLREAAAGPPVSLGAWSADSPAPGFPRLGRVAQALTAVHALDVATAQDILADFAIAVGVRQHSDQGLLLLAHSGYASGMRARAWSWAAGGRGWPAGRGRAALTSGPSRPGPGPSRTGPDRFLPLGVTASFRDGDVSGELILLSYVHTGAGARFTVTWRTSGADNPARPGRATPGPGFPMVFTVKDDKGASYRLEFRFTGGPDWAGEMRVLPDPPERVRWLEFSAPGEPAVRISLEDGDEGTSGPAGQAGRSTGEHLLNAVADRMLVIAAEYPQDLRLRLAATAQGPLSGVASGLGDVVAALEAAEVLSPLSTLPGQLVSLCASLRVGGHGLAAPPADLPERWLSVLAHYQRRRPHTAPARDGHAAVAAAFPGLDGVRLALLGLHNTDGETRANLLLSGLAEDESWLPGLESVPLSVWVRDGIGRWHVGSVAGSDYADGEYLLRMKLVPPLARSTAWIEVVAAWRSAEVSATVPLRWGFPP